LLPPFSGAFAGLFVGIGLGLRHSNLSRCPYALSSRNSLPNFSTQVWKCR
jgi:hypothetical protein